MVLKNIRFSDLSVSFVTSIVRRFIDTKIRTKIAKYKKRDTFCVLAWNHLHLTPNGAVKMCCIAGEDIHDKGKPYNLYSHTYEEIWNSAYMRSARKGMSKGKWISACQRCYMEEDTLGESRRTQQNARWLSEYNKLPEQFIAETVVNDFYIKKRPQFLQLNLGNLCNLACRMCSSLYSSRIEKDSVHNKWMPASHVDVARWKGKQLVIGPKPTIGVHYHGFYEYELNNFDAIRWSNGDGRVNLKAPTNVTLTGIGLRFRMPSQNKRNVEIMLNDISLFKGHIDDSLFEQTFNIEAISSNQDIEVRIKSAVSRSSGRNIGICLERIWFERSQENENKLVNERALTRFEKNAGWWGQPELLFGEMLSEPNKMRSIIFQGGEPLLVKEVVSIMDHLIQNDAAGNVTIEIVSNLTTVQDSFLEKLRNFRQVELICSIDGIKADLEYIRYPASWPEIEHNLDTIAELENVNVNFSVAVQAYNIMNITDLITYCDMKGYHLFAHFLVGPGYLNVLVLPKSARLEALRRIKAYLASEGDKPNQQSAEYMVTFLEQHKSDHYSYLIKDFMFFTNDMDVSRKQSFHNTHTELVNYFSGDGFEWNFETRFAQTNLISN
jgi:MoaA/NifB/PqqE/SkfB family radical SAM enzyme